MNKKSILSNIRICLFAVVFTLLITTTAQAQTVSNKEEKEAFYKSMLAFMNENINPQNYSNPTSMGYYEFLKGEAEYATSSANTDYEKIRDVARFVANQVYYDYENFNAGTVVNVPTDPYTVLTGGLSVCAGYANLSQELLRLAGVPCMSIFGEEHQYNAAYDSENKRWVIFDATWMSKNGYYGPGKRVSAECDDTIWFDATPSVLADSSNHEIFGIAGISVGDFQYGLSIEYGYEDPETRLNWNEYEIKMAVTGVDTSVVDAVIPESIMGMPVMIADFRFSRCSSLKSVVIEADIKEIPSNFFNYCKSLERVEFKHGPESIGNDCFSSCSNLKEVIIPAGIKEIAYATFYYCTSLQELVLPDTVEYIDDKAFTGCRGMRKLVIPSSVTYINPNAVGGMDYANLVIYCKSGSYAEQLFKGSGYKYAIYKDFTGLKMENDKLVYYDDGKLDENYTGLAEYEGEKYFVLKGKADTNYTGIRTLNGEYLAIWNGKFVEDYIGLQNNSGVFWYIEGGKVATTYSGLYENEAGIWYVCNGKIDVNFTGLALKDGKWLCVRNGRYYPDYTGMVYNGGAWWYVENGELNVGFDGIYTNDGGTWFVKGGKIFTEYTGLFQIDGVFYYVSTGKVTVNYTGMVKNNGDFWYVEKGILKQVTGVVDTPTGKWRVVNGKLIERAGN